MNEAYRGVFLIEAFFFVGSLFLYFKVSTCWGINRRFKLK